MNFAAEKGVNALAITDHDTMAAIAEATTAAANQDVEIIPGLELSTVYNGRSMHILGYYPDPQKLAAYLAREGASPQFSIGFLR